MKEGHTTRVAMKTAVALPGIREIHIRVNNGTTTSRAFITALRATLNCSARRQSSTPARAGRVFLRLSLTSSRKRLRGSRCGRIGNPRYGTARQSCNQTECRAAALRATSPLNWERREYRSLRWCIRDVPRGGGTGTLQLTFQLSDGPRFCINCRREPRLAIHNSRQKQTAAMLDRRGAGVSFQQPRSDGGKRRHSPR